MENLKRNKEFIKHISSQKNLQLTFCNISCKSLLGLLHEAAASQKNIKSGTTPAGFTVIIWHMPRKAESFSSLSRMLRKEEHLYKTNEFKEVSFKIIIAITY